MDFDSKGIGISRHSLDRMLAELFVAKGGKIINKRYESDQNKEPIENCIKRYLDNFLNANAINKKEYEKILVKWLNTEIKLLKGVNNES